jgi:integrase
MGGRTMSAKTPRPKGDGAIFYDSVGDRWVGRVEVRTTNGRRLRPTVTGKSRSDVAAKLARLREKVAKGELTERTERGLTVEALLERWLAANHKWAPATRENYRYAAGIATRHLGPRLVAELNVAEVEDALSAAVAGQEGEDGHKPLGHNTVGRVRHVLSAAIAWAARRELVPPRNPAAVAQLPEAAPPAEQRALTAAEAQAFVKVANGHRLAVLAHLGLMGLRPGEVLALGWSDVDLERGLIAVVHTLRWPTKGEPELADVKGGQRAGNKSLRVLAMPASALEAMRRHHAAQAEEAALMVGHWPAEWADLVVRSPQGRPVHPRTHRQHFKRWARDAKVDGPLHRYTLRHTTGSLLYDQGMSDSVVADWLGNSRVTTRRHYLHAVSEYQSAGAELLGAILEPPADGIGSRIGSLLPSEGDDSSSETA